MKIHADYNQYVPINTAAKVLKIGRGFVHGIIVTTANAGTAESLILYDNTAASGNILIKVHAYIYAPVIILFDRIRPLEFAIGLTAKTSTYADAFIIMEA